MLSQQSVAFIGGTGPEGMGLALRFAAAGRAVIIGSRRPERAVQAANKVREAAPGASVRGLDNREAVAAADVIVITVPFEAQSETLRDLQPHLAGKTVIDTVVPLQFERGVVSVLTVIEGSAAQQAASLLPGSHVAAAFHHLSAPKLMDLGQDVSGDVLICADNAAAKAVAMELAACIKGCRGIDAGGLANARHVEAFTAVLLSINRTYKTRASVRVTGL